MSKERIRGLILDRIFLTVFGTGVLITVVACLAAPSRVQIGFLGILLSLVTALIVTALRQVPAPQDDNLAATQTSLAKNEEMFEIYRSLDESLTQISANRDPIFRELAIDRVKSVSADLVQIAKGRIIFTGTEAWQSVYEHLLRNPDLYNYRSIAFVRTKDYWQDETGRQCMQVNLEVHDKATLNIERIAIFPDGLWPAGEHFPRDPFRDWIDQQHNHGIWIKLVRQSAIADEPDLVADLGIYDDRAVGLHELDERARTVRFVLMFDSAEVLAAKGRWERLSARAISYRKLLDRSAPNA